MEYTRDVINVAWKQPFLKTASSADVKKCIYKILNVMYMYSYQTTTLRNLNLQLGFASDTSMKCRNHV